MRTIAVLAASVAVTATPSSADAQSAHRGVTRPPMVRPVHPGVRPTHPGVRQPGPRWGGKVGGRWVGGHYAPGGWQGYRAPVRGFVLPSYWFAPRFFIQDYPTYGLVAPQTGYRWVRYYDDAVLVDGGWRVHDMRRGIDWDRYDDGRYLAPVEDHYDDRVVDHGYAERRDSGVGGAVIGGIAGGVAGNVIAGRGNRTLGTVIGAGVGAVAGTAIDRAEDRRRGPGAGYPAPGYDAPGAPYDDVPVAPDHAPPPPVVFAAPAEQVQGSHREHGAQYDRREYVERHEYRSGPDYREHHAGPPPRIEYGQFGGGSYSTQTVTSGGGYVAGGWYYPPATVTTVTVTSAPVVTTTTTVEETVSYEGVATKRRTRATPKRRLRSACRCD